MRNIKKYKLPFINLESLKTKVRFIQVLFLSTIFSYCSIEPRYWEPKSQELLIGEYVENEPDNYSEFNKLLDETGKKSLLNVRGPFTLFLPDNDAMFAYYQLKNVNTLDDLSDSFKEDLVLNHIIGIGISTNDFGLGALVETNALGDFVVSEFQGADIIVGKYSKIIKRNIITANGYIHIIDRVMDPVYKDVYTLLSEDPAYKIFSEGLALTGLKDTLQIIDLPYGEKTARTRFTLFAVTDSVYNQHGIFTVNDLITWCNANSDSLTYMKNPFYRYIEYHCLTGCFYLSDFNTTIYPILSRNNAVSMTINDDYKINLDNKTNDYTGFIIPKSNIPAKNGAIHAINNLMPAIEAKPATVIFETTDFFDMSQGDYYKKNYKRFFNGNSDFAKIKWTGDYMLYYYKPINTGALINDDCVSMSGWWSISITFPKVMKGKYEVSIFQPNWNDITNCVAYVDGVPMPNVYEGQYGGTGGSAGLQVMGEVDFKTTAEHTITIRNVVYGMLFWDYVQFSPID